jgi:hypothetical protein
VTLEGHELRLGALSVVPRGLTDGNAFDPRREDGSTPNAAFGRRTSASAPGWRPQRRTGSIDCPDAAREGLPRGPATVAKECGDFT